MNIFTVLHMLEFCPLSYPRTVLAACLYYASLHRGDRHLSVMDEIRHCLSLLHQTTTTMMAC